MKMDTFSKNRCEYNPENKSRVLSAVSYGRILRDHLLVGNFVGAPCAYLNGLSTGDRPLATFGNLRHLDRNVFYSLITRPLSTWLVVALPNRGSFKPLLGNADHHSQSLLTIADHHYD